MGKLFPQAKVFNTHGKRIMKSEFKTKLIQHMLNKKNGEKGFTLIELLVVIIIIGILAAIALPSFLNQAAKARQSESKTYVGSMNRSQQAYLLEKQRYSPNLQTLGLGIAGTTANFAYGTTGNYVGTSSGTIASSYGLAELNGSGNISGTVGVITGDSMTQSTNAATSKSYIGNVATVTQVTGGEPTALGTVCEQTIVNTSGTAGLTSASIALTNGAVYMTITTNAAPRCVTGANYTHFVPIQ